MNEKVILTNEQEYQQAQAELNARKKPSGTLRFMMQALEDYCQSKKYGWSRPWNKYAVVNFQSFKLNDTDSELRNLTAQLIDGQWPQMPQAARDFIDELLVSETTPMGYLFFQEFTDNDVQYEGAVISYGRINKENRRFRDRLDVILESPVHSRISGGLSRLRIYVDPYHSSDKKPLWQAVVENPHNPLAYQLFNVAAELSWAWEEDKNRVWKHWVTEYIDYFGPRQWAMRQSYFHVPGKPEARIIATTANEPDTKAI